MEKNKRTRKPHVKVSLHNKVTTGGILLFFDYSQVSVLRIFFFYIIAVIVSVQF